MHIDTNCLWAPPAVILAALCAAACTPSPTRSPPSQGAQSPEQRLASITNTRLRSTDYLNGLAVAVQAEKRDDRWAAEKESELRTSFAAERSLPDGMLNTVECRSSKCSLQLHMNAERSPKAAVDQQAAVIHWIAVSQPCGYTMTNPTGALPTMLIFLDCRR
jgi:hypothetical protein